MVVRSFYRTTILPLCVNLSWNSNRSLWIGARRDSNKKQGSILGTLALRLRGWQVVFGRWIFSHVRKRERNHWDSNLDGLELAAWVLYRHLNLHGILRHFFFLIRCCHGHGSIFNQASSSYKYKYKEIPLCRITPLLLTSCGKNSMCDITMIYSTVIKILLRLRSSPRLSPRHPSHCLREREKGHLKSKRI